MPDWTITIFGHYHNEWALIDKEGTSEAVAVSVSEPQWDADKKLWIVDAKTYPEKDYALHQFVDCEKRARPGDISWFKPRGVERVPNVKRKFLLVNVTGLTKAQMLALCETEWDLDSYRSYAPMDYTTWYQWVYERYNNKPEPQRTKALQVLTVEHDDMYAEYLRLCQERAEKPLKVWRKRRFHLKLDDLESLGVNIERMLDATDMYTPELPTIDKTATYDKLLDRYTASDAELNQIQPRTLAEMENPQTANQIITELRA